MIVCHGKDESDPVSCGVNHLLPTVEETAMNKMLREACENLWTKANDKEQVTLSLSVHFLYQ